MKIKLSIIASLLIILSACNVQKANTETSKTKRNVGISEMEKTHNIKLKKGELLVVAIADQKAKKETLLQLHTLFHNTNF